MSDAEMDGSKADNAEKTQAPENPAPTPPVTLERVADTALGALVSAAEALETAAKLIREHGPAVVDAWEKKGRPIRERILESLRGIPFVETKPETSEATTETPRSASDEISTLERRVRELEQQISSGDLELVETPAEAATFNGEVWETPEERDALADTPYAISETAEEQAAEAAAESPSEASPAPATPVEAASSENQTGETPAPTEGEKTA